MKNYKIVEIDPQTGEKGFWMGDESKGTSALNALKNFYQHWNSQAGGIKNLCFVVENH